jgi:hypothetical protein
MTMAKSKSEERRIEAQEEKKEAPKDKYRYVCDACTNVAGMSVIPFSVVSITCAVCGKSQLCKKENWIKI